jgi:hypothetical protein
MASLIALAQTISPGVANVPHRVTGPFDVKVAPLETYVKGDAGLGRFSIDKEYHGALEATAAGEMLSAGSAASSGGYVAIERVAGTLDGRSGSFVLQHSATMDAGTPHLSIAVVPGSGTGGLAGITGRMDIGNDGGKHSYVFEYILR